jgi:Protein of unknwon function (DUF3310)
MIYAHTGASLKTATMVEPTPTPVPTPSEPTQPEPDPVNHPRHYTFGYFEVIDVLQDWFPRNPLLWQVGKYIARAERKGRPLEDLCKARFYLNREIERLADKQAKET